MWSASIVFFPDIWWAEGVRPLHVLYAYKSTYLLTYLLTDPSYIFSRDQISQSSGSTPPGLYRFHNVFTASCGCFEASCDVLQYFTYTLYECDKSILSLYRQTGSVTGIHACDLCQPCTRWKRHFEGLFRAGQWAFIRICTATAL